MSITPLRIDEEDLISVEFGGFSDTVKTTDGGSSRADDEGGDLRIMGLDVRDQSMGGKRGYLIALAFSDSTVKVSLPQACLI